METLPSNFYIFWSVLIEQTVNRARTLKKIIIISRPNGACKTTFARDFLPLEAQTLRFVNADLIAAGLSPFNPDVAAAVKAARLMLKEIDDYPLQP